MLALPPYLDAFESRYPASASSDAECQLCHVSAGGGSPWNSYGWGIRNLLVADTIVQAMANMESDNSDGSATDNLNEIVQGTQPGWGVGDVNRFYSSTGDFIADQPPPTSLPADTLIDPGSPAVPGPQNDPISGGIPLGNISVGFEAVASGFNAPILAQRLAGENNLYVVEQTGGVKRVDLATGSVSDYLNFSGVLVNINSGYDERGLLGFAFHPNFSSNNKIYTYTSEPVNGVADFSTLAMGEVADHQAVITEWVVSNHAAMPASATVSKELMRVDQPNSNHNGGSIEFGPDGYLFIAFGDGGSRDDEGSGHVAGGNSQDFESPLGAVLRIDVDGANSANGRYGIPVGLSGNPFIDGTQVTPGLDEAYVFGFRNPYRISINDLGGGDFELYVGDVGQDNIEEVNRISSDQSGGNYGWRLKEGSFFFHNSPAICSSGLSCVSQDPPQGIPLPNMIDPIVEYDHDEGLSVIGGQVYRGATFESLSDLYVFADWSNGFTAPNGRLFYVDSSGTLREFQYMQKPQLFISAVSRDNAGELYVVGSQSLSPASNSGELKRLVFGEVTEVDELCVPIHGINGKVALICL